VVIGDDKLKMLYVTLSPPYCHLDEGEIPAK
jgi:hypothetical protein